MIFYTLIPLGILAAILFYYFKKRLKQRAKTPIRLAKSAESLSACVEVLKKSLYMDIFAQDINQNLEQVERFIKKRETIDGILLQKFSSEEISYKKFDGVLVGVEKIIYINLRSIINKISAFDYEEYKQLDSLEWKNDELKEEKQAIYARYLEYVDGATRDNEEILLKLDKLLLEITQFNNLTRDDIMNMPAMQELDNLIKYAKLYNK